MKFSCAKKELSDSLSNLQRAVSSKSSLPVLEGILLKASDGMITLSAFDLEIGITTSIPASVSEEGEIVLNAKILTDIIRKMPSESIGIATDEKLSAILTGGPAEFTILGIPASEFPELPSLTDGTAVNLTQNMLASMIRQTLFAVSTDDSKPIITGSLFELSDGVFRITSVDGYRLATRAENVAEHADLSFVVPGKTLGEVLKLLDPESEETISVSVGKRHILFEINGYSIISRLLEGQFLDYRNVLDKQCTSTVRTKVRNFTESVDRTSLLISERLKSPLRCVFGPQSIKISCSTTIGKAFDEIPALTEGNDVEIGFNNKYLLDALRATECDEIRIELNGPLSPMKIFPPEGESFIFLVLPVRLKSNE